MAWIKRKNSFQQASTIIVALFPLLLLIKLAKCISKRSCVDSACTWDGFPTFHQQPNYSWNNKTQHKKNNYKKGVSPKATVHTKNPIICEFRKINKKNISINFCQNITENKTTKMPDLRATALIISACISSHTSFISTKIYRIAHNYNYHSHKRNTYH